jgi:glycosyltransferase involved in cell wall biosynthesis
MNVTVAICTWNRAGLLDQTLTRMRALCIPDGVDWELLVVNNNCTDDTDAVIARHSEMLPIRRIFEPRQGLSIARNAAVAAARGELILWTDDDVLVDPDWLAAYVAAARRWPDAGYFGGEITPWYEADPPRWIEPNLPRLQGMLVVRQLGDEEKAFEGPEFPYGASMAFRRSILERFPFDPKIGYVGDRKMQGDETWLLTRLDRMGVQGVWVPSAKVRHFIPKERATVRFMEEYFYWHGRTLARLELYPEVPRLWGVPRYLYRLHWAHLRKYYIARLLNRSEWPSMCIKASQFGGRIAELRSRAKLDAGASRRAGANSGAVA